MNARESDRGNAARARRARKARRCRRPVLLERMEARRLLANVVVNTLADETIANATTSLREAVAIANPGDSIVFQPGLSGQITLGGSPIVIDTFDRIVGPGAGTISVSGNNVSRVFEIVTPFGGGADISGITIKQGRAERGGGIYVGESSRVELTNVVLSGNTAAGAPGNDTNPNGGEARGGAIYNDRGRLTITGGALTDNLAVGGSGSFAGDPTSQYGSGGWAFGGAIHGDATIDGTLLRNNIARGGQGLSFTVGGSGGYAFGGALFGSFTVSGATFEGNRALGGDTGDGDFDAGSGGDGRGGAVHGTGSFVDTTFTNNAATGGSGTGVTELLLHTFGGWGLGGAILGEEMGERALSLSRCTFAGNTASGGVGGAVASGGAVDTNDRFFVRDSTFTGNRALGSASLVNTWRGGSSSGGAISAGGVTEISGSTFTGNRAVGGKGANADASRGREVAAAPGGDASGGAITASPGGVEVLIAPRITNCTFFGNAAQGGAGGDGYDAVPWDAGAGGSASGGAIAASSLMDLTASTIAGNTVIGGAQGLGSGSGGNGPAKGGGLAVSGTRTVNIANTIIATNAGGTPDVSGIVSSLGFNLIGKTTATSGWIATDKTGIASVPLDPKLAPLTNNGGPTQTMLLLAGSPAIDAGKSFGLTTDQRGLPRIVDIASIANAAGGDGTDIGAVEVQSSAPTQTPFKTFNIGTTPITIQAEDFDNGGEGVAYHDVDAANLGGKYRATGVDIAAATTTGVGFQVGWTRAGEWLEYTVNVQTAGTYNLAFGVASNGAGGKFHLEVDGVDKTGPLTVPNTGGWYTTSQITRSGVVLGTGTHVLRLKMDANGATGNVGNFNYFTITKAATTTVTTVTTDTAAHVRDGSFAGANFGNAASLEVKKSTTGFNREAYLKFNLASVASISNAKLRIFGGMDVAASIQLGVHGSSNTGWTELGLIWNNRNPAATGAAALSSVTVSGTTAKWYELDVTAYLKGEKLAGRNTVTLVLKSATGTSALARFAADGAANAPHLVVTS